MQISMRWTKKDRPEGRPKSREETPNEGMLPEGSES